MTAETERKPVCSRDKIPNQLSTLKTYTYQQHQIGCIIYSYVCVHVSILKTEKRNRKEKYENIKIKKTDVKEHNEQFHLMLILRTKDPRYLKSWER